MTASLTENLLQWLQSGMSRMGQVRITTYDQFSRFTLTHVQDSSEDTSLEEFHSPQDARFIVLYSESNEFRPLKGAPDLKRGWKLHLDSLENLRLALDFIYPAAIGLYSQFLSKKLTTTPLRETLERQTGMYRVARKITDAQAQEVIQSTCDPHKKCQRLILWKLDDTQDITSLPEGKFDLQGSLGSDQGKNLPFLCREACNFVVAEAREKVKAAQS